MDVTALLHLPPLALFNVGGTELMIILVLVLILFGGDKMPELARGLGKALREFKKMSAGVEQEIKRAMEEPPPPPPKAYPPIAGATPYSVPPPPSPVPSSLNTDGAPPVPDLSLAPPPTTPPPEGPAGATPPPTPKA